MTLKDNVQPIEIDFSLVESALNVFTELEINLPVNLQSNEVFDLDLLEFKMSPSFDPVAAGATSHDFQFTLNSQSALLPWTNNQIIASGTNQAHASAALIHSGTDFYGMHNDSRGRANLIARTSIFLGIDSLNTTVVWTMEGRLIGSLVKIDQKALTQLVLNQLT